MEQTLSSIQSSLVEEISSSKNEPQWLKEYRKNSLSIYNELPAEVSPLYGKYTDAKRMDPEMVSEEVVNIRVILFDSTNMENPAMMVMAV